MGLFTHKPASLEFLCGGLDAVAQHREARWLQFLCFQQLLLYLFSKARLERCRATVVRWLGLTAIAHQ